MCVNALSVELHNWGDWGEFEAECVTINSEQTKRKDDHL